jgi:hypothetical protein
MIPDGLKVTIFCWRQKTGGADFHARYLITDKGGIAVDAGFGADGAHQTTDKGIEGKRLTYRQPH